MMRFTVHIHPRPVAVIAEANLNPCKRLSDNLRRFAKYEVIISPPEKCRLLQPRSLRKARS